MLPFKLQPAFVDYLWGGERLRTEFHKQSEKRPLAESWELSCHPNGPSLVATGPQAGKPFDRLVEESDRAALLGRSCARFTYFPLLIKLIDARLALSIQVHPGDGYAMEHEHSYGKTEMWYILDALPDSFIYYGVREGVTREGLRDAIRENRLEDLLGKRPVKKGDVVFIPAGMIHAIGAGILVCEVQQNSDITYRVYDFARRDASGNLRELHVEKALDVADLSPAAGDFSPLGAPQPCGDGECTLLSACGYFTVERLRLSGALPGHAAGDSFHSLICTEGQGALECGGESLPFSKGESIFIPADAGAYTLRGECECIRSMVAPA